MLYFVNLIFSWYVMIREVHRSSLILLKVTIHYRKRVLCHVGKRQGIGASEHGKASVVCWHMAWQRRHAIDYHGRLSSAVFRATWTHGRTLGHGSGHFFGSDISEDPNVSQIGETIFQIRGKSLLYPLIKKTVPNKSLKTQTKTIQQQHHRAMPTPTTGPSCWSV
jgi:hypothetical protein